MTLTRLSVRDGVGTVSLNRPDRHNSLVPELLDSLLGDLGRLAAAPDLHAVVLRAEGPSFSTGGDVRAFHDQGMGIERYAAELVGLLNRAILAILDLQAPVLARVHGPVTGGSLGLVLAADLVAVTPAVFFAPYYVDVGFSPDGGWTAILPDRIGRHRAGAVQLLNRHISAEDAVAWGLATELVDADRLDATIDGWLAALAEKVPGSVASTRRRLLDGARRARYAEDLEQERLAFLAQIGTDEARRGMARFLRLTG